eukprot:Opistho-1_new@76964
MAAGRLALFVGLACVVSLSVTVVVADGPGKYKDGDVVALFVNKVGPFYNPSETYDFYSLPGVCKPVDVKKVDESLGEVLTGDRMQSSLFVIKFNEDAKRKPLCSVSLSPDDIRRLKAAIEEYYYFEFVLDDIPLHGLIGTFEEVSFPHEHYTYLYTHFSIFIEHNGDRIIYANITMDHESSVSLGEKLEQPISYTYSVTWISTSDTLSDRARRLESGVSRRSGEIHWISIFNSLVLVVLLTGLVGVILARVLNNDFARYSRVDAEAIDDDDASDYGWKLIHGDVFRFPTQKSLFCAILGAGTQFLALATFLIVMAIIGLFNVHNHGSMNSAAIVLYAMTSCISGYVSGSFYKKLGGENWVWNIMLTVSIFTAPVFLIWSLLNSLAWYYHSTQALPFTTIILLVLMWLFVGFPLTVVGGILGKNQAGAFDAPCRTKNIPREIPPIPWYRSGLVQMFVGGFLPFSAISVELYYVFETLWGREPYTLFGILFLVYMILLVVTAFISVALTYFQLSMEDYRWWWRSVFNGGCTGFFVFVYAIFYYFRRTNMSGPLQTAQFFGYTLLFCLVFFLMLGAASFFSSLVFVRYIFKTLRTD